MGPAAAEFLHLLTSRELRHGGNPIATLCASNVTVHNDPTSNEKRDKERSTEKINAIVAAIQAGKGPPSLIQPKSATADLRPIVARLPR